MCYQYRFRCFTTLMVIFRFRCFTTLMVIYRFCGFATLKLIMMCYCFRCFATLKVADTCVIACIALQPSRQLIHVLPLSLLCNLHSENVINIVLQCTAFILDNNQHFYCFATLLYSVTVDVAFVTVDVASQPVTPQLMSHKVAIAS